MLLLSRRNFPRRFKKATSNTVIENTGRVKIEAVKKGLETSEKQLSISCMRLAIVILNLLEQFLKNVTVISANKANILYSKKLKPLALVM